MKALYKTLLASAVAAGIAIPASSYATNGIFLIGYGAKARAMGGAQVAMAKDAVDAAINPAAATYSGNRLDAGLMVINPQRRAACCLAPDGIVSEGPYYYIPNMAGTMKYTDDITLGFGFMGYGGGGTRYKPSIFSSNTPDGYTGIRYELGVMSPSIAYKVDDTQSVGVALLIGIQRFNVDGLHAFTRFSRYPDSVTSNGFSWSYGAGVRLGWQGHYMDDKLSLGASYSSTIYMSEFDEYKGLFADKGKMDVPGNIILGLAYKPMDDLTIAFDWQHTFYEDVAAIGNRTLPVSASGDPTDPNLMGQPTGPGFGWTDQDIFKLGAEYQWDSQWTIRAGVNYGASPIRDETGGGEFEVNVVAPAVTTLHFTAGGSYQLDQQQEISFAFMYAPANKETQQISADTDLPFSDQLIELEMRQYAIEVSYGYNF